MRRAMSRNQRTSSVWRFYLAGAHSPRRARRRWSTSIRSTRAGAVGTCNCVGPARQICSKACSTNSSGDRIHGRSSTRPSAPRTVTDGDSVVNGTSRRLPSCRATPATVTGSSIAALNARNANRPAAATRHRRSSPQNFLERRPPMLLAWHPPDRCGVDVRSGQITVRSCPIDTGSRRRHGAARTRPRRPVVAPRAR